jgi:hypothetical protein
MDTNQSATLGAPVSPSMRDAAIDAARALQAAAADLAHRIEEIGGAQDPAAGEESKFLQEVLAEFLRARKLFPSPDGLICAAGEEFGEVCKAYLDESKTRVREECVQLAAMAARIALEGDPTLEGYRAKRGADKKPYHERDHVFSPWQKDPTICGLCTKKKEEH